MFVCYKSPQRIEYKKHRFNHHEISPKSSLIDLHISVVVFRKVIFPLKMGHFKFFVATWMCVLWLNFHCIYEVAAFGECYVLIKDVSYERTFAGSLVTTKCVLTAAEPCYNGRSSAGSLKAMAGVTSGNERDIQTCDVDEVLIHPEWNQQSLANNVALLLLVKAFILTDAVVLIPLGCLITESPVTTVVVDNIYRPVYEEVPSMVVNSDNCAAVYNQSGQTFVCTEQKDGSNAFEREDIGSGLIQNKQLIGCLIAVAGRKYMDVPNLFTSIASVYEWISAVSNGVIKCKPRSRGRSRLRLHPYRKHRSGRGRRSSSRGGWFSFLYSISKIILSIAPR